MEATSKGLRHAAWISVLCLCAAPALRADGPHWHVPNPDGDDTTFDNNPDGKRPADPKAPPAGKNPLPGVGGGGAGNGQQDYMHNPGNFMTMDQPCIGYYERHCVIKHAKDDLKFYLLIMNRCAQAMREVDTYLPCPDSFPLWHTEELRELMLVFAHRTWVRSTRLKREYAEACAKFCVQCYFDTVRFGNPAQDNQGGKLKDAAEGNKKLQALLEKMSNEKDAAKRQALWKECTGALGASKAQLAQALVTFKLMTGDIPPQVSDAESRMVDALVEMGTIVLGPLGTESAGKSAAVQKAARTVTELIRHRLSNPAKQEASLSNVLEQLRWLSEKPGSAEAQAALKILKAMDSGGIENLIRIAENETLNMKAVALKALSSVSGKALGSDLARWKSYLEELRAAKNPPPQPVAVEKPKEKEQEKSKEEGRVGDE